MKPNETEGAAMSSESTGKVRTSTNPGTTQPVLVPVARGPLPQGVSWALRFLSGPRAGTELPLRPSGDLVFGRGKEADCVLAEDLVSRRHAILSLDGDGPTISDCGSTNGTFLNGERVNGKAPLKSGDRLLIGTSIARLVEESDEETTTVGAGAPSLVDREKRPAQGSTMAGRLEEVPLVDLIQLFCNSRKSGTLVARGSDGLDGEVRLQTGQLTAARIEGKPFLLHRKALMRLLRLEGGAFEFIPAPAGAPEETQPAELQEPTELLLMDSLRIMDEYRVIEPELPASHASLVLPKPLPGRLRALEPAALDLVQLVLEHGTFGAVIDHAAVDDVEAARGVVRLISLGFVQVQG